jgi:hypothetical protein
MAGKNLKFYATDSGAHEAELLSGGERHIDNSVSDERTTIIDADDHRLIVFQARDFDLGAKCKGTMRRGHLMHVVPLTTGRAPAMILAAIIGSEAGSGHVRR